MIEVQDIHTHNKILRLLLGSHVNTFSEPRQCLPQKGSQGSVFPKSLPQKQNWKKHGFLLAI